MEDSFYICSPSTGKFFPGSIAFTVVRYGPMLSDADGMMDSTVSSRSSCDLRTHFPCRTTPSICIELSQVRDGRTDCPDGSDEGKQTLV
ncbi:hypothetical protein AVEN_191634-1 [Araneus ventricosus]|uniref:Uncharacterized protein n=1 Tax=Araneus ventricosus TaxID=182803 RepID=A0A4Y2P425_ARAVE|nr:hypothetical protein AVEN_191634-1 [Araneus ventricosus]